MSWRRLFDWLKGKKPQALQAAETLEDLARRAEGAIDEARPDRVRGVRIPRARYLLILLAVALFVGISYLGWRLWPAKVDRSLTPVQTQGDVQVYTSPQTPAMQGAERLGVKTHAATRTVKTYRTEDLPKEEQARIPVVPPPTAEMTAAAAADNCLRDGQLVESEECRKRHPGLYLRPELARTAVVPPSRGDTEVRSYLLPSGDLMTTLERKPEPFFGLEWKHLELEGGPVGWGGKQADAQATWLPLRIGNFHVGVRAEGWMEKAGELHGAATIRLRWEPFRDSYR